MTSPVSTATARRRSATRGAILAASLAAIAEAGLIFLPLSLVAKGSTETPFLPLPVFLLGFVVATALATLFGDAARMPYVAAAAGGVLGAGLAAVFWAPRFFDIGAAVVLALAITFRAVTLGRRDWRTPVSGSFAVGAVVLIVEIVASDSESTGWAPLLPFIVPVFFLASLASRAVSARLAGAPEGGGGARVHRGLTASMLVGGLALAMGIGAALGGPDGALARLGRFVFPVLSWVVSVLSSVISVLSWPIFWLLERVGVDASGLQRTLQEASDEGLRGAQQGAPTPRLLARIVGLLVLAGLIALLVVLFRRVGRSRARARRDLEEFGPPPEPLFAGRRPGRRRLWRSRRVLPDERIRRWYAEVLVLLERQGVARGASRTPKEHLAVVVDAYPEVRADFAALTRSYEDVRYGSVDVPEAVALDIRRRYVRITQAVRAHRAPEPAAPGAAP